jgi:hypothetical protein
MDNYKKRSIGESNFAGMPMDDDIVTLTMIGDREKDRRKGVSPAHFAQV